MSDTANEPFQPTSNIIGAKVQKVYSPTQIAVAAFIGGFVSVIYFLYANFVALDNEDGKSKTLLYGTMFTVALIAILPFLPDNTPSMPFIIAYVVAGRTLSEKYQMTKKDIIESNEFDFHSNWRVFGISLLCMVASVVIVVVPIMLLMMTGIIH